MEKIRAATILILGFVLATVFLWLATVAYYVMFSLPLFGIYGGEALILLTVSNLPVLSIYGAYKRRASIEGRLSWTRTLTLSVIVILLFSAYLLAQVLAVSA